MKYTVYHNPRCSTSRKAVDYLKEHGKEIEIIEYLKNVPSEAEISALLKKLNLPATDIVRKNELLYKEQYKDKNLSEKEWIKVLAQNPVLIQRPIVVKGEKAVLARPIEDIATL